MESRMDHVHNFTLTMDISFWNSTQDRLQITHSTTEMLHIERVSFFPPFLDVLK